MVTETLAANTLALPAADQSVAATLRLVQGSVSRRLSLAADAVRNIANPLPIIFAAAFLVSPANSQSVNKPLIDDVIAKIEATGRCMVEWPAGLIYTTGGHTFDSSYQTHFGAGGINRTTAFVNTSANVLFTLGNDTTLTNDYAFHGIGFYTPAGGTGIWARYTQNIYINDFYENCDTFLRLGDATAAGGTSRIHLINGEGLQVASSSLLSHIKHEWMIGEYKRINLNIEGQRQVNTIGEDFASNKSGITIDGGEMLGGYMGRFDINMKVGATRLTNFMVTGVNFEGGGTAAFHLSTSAATGGMGQCKITHCNFGTDAVDGSWAATPLNPIYIYINNASVSFDANIVADNTFTSVTRTTCSYIECAAGVISGCRFGGIAFRGVMKDTAQFLSHIKGGSTATITNCSHGPVHGISLTNALAGGIKFEGSLEVSEPDKGKVPSTVRYFIDDSHTLDLEQEVRIRIVNTAGTMQHSMTDLTDGTAAAPADKVARFTATSATLQNTPTATDSSTAFAGGGKISSGDPSRFILDLIAPQVVGGCQVLSCDVVENDIDSNVIFKPVFLNSNVNSVTQIRLALEQRRTSDGATLGINATNYDAGEGVSINLRIRAR